jgi:hypothetical protein
MLNHKGFYFWTCIKKCVQLLIVSSYFKFFFTNCLFALKLTIDNNGLLISPKKMFVKMLEEDTKISIYVMGHVEYKPLWSNISNSKL